MTVQSSDSVSVSPASSDMNALAGNQDGNIEGLEALPTTERLSDISDAAGCIGMTSYGIQTSPSTSVSPSDRIHVNLHFVASCDGGHSEVLAVDVSDSDPNNQYVDISQYSNTSQEISSISITQNESTCQQCPFCQRSSVRQQRSETNTDGEILFLVDQILELLHSHMSAMLASGQDLLQKLIVLIEFFKHEFLMKDPSGESAAFPYSVLEQYTLLIKNCGIQKLFGNKFDIPCRRNAVLCLLSEWLGSQLHSLSDVLHCRVEEFKQRNINCIENLPCPRTLVDLVFPRCMQILLVYWLGEQEEETEEPYAVADHSYSAVRRSHCPNSATPAATPSTSTPDKFPFIQFILEFANNALISGVAHVVYSRLVNSC